MVDMDESLIQLAMVAVIKARGDAAREDAHELHERCLNDQTQMILLARSAYGERLEPVLAPDGRVRTDSLQRLSGLEIDPAFYRHVVTTQREAIAAIDSMLPRLHRADVKRLAQRLRTAASADVTTITAKTQ